jgi:hypothetical protein
MAWKQWWVLPYLKISQEWYRTKHFLASIALEELLRRNYFEDGYNGLTLCNHFLANIVLEVMASRPTLTGRISEGGCEFLQAFPTKW